MLAGWCQDGAKFMPICCDTCQDSDRIVPGRSQEGPRKVPGKCQHDASMMPGSHPYDAKL
eukprot:1279733-Alexandrium_andersonii.AAC.2